MKRGCLAAAMAVLLGIAGCVPTLHSLYAPEDLMFEPALVGRWAPPDGKSSWTFTKSGDKEYKLLFVDDKGKPGTFTAHMLKLKDHMFLDLYPQGPELQENDFFKMNLLPAHSFLRVDQITPTVKLAPMNPDWIKKFLAEHPDAVRHEEMENFLVLTAPTPDLQAFVMKHVDEADAWGKIEEMTRQLEADVPVHPEGLADNAALRYWLAFAMMPQLSDEQRELLSANLGPAPLDGEVVDIVIQARQCLNFMERASELRQCDWGLVWEGPITLMPHLSKMRDLARLAALRMRYRCSQGDGSGAVTDALIIFTLARHSQSDGDMIASLVGRAVEGIVIKAMTADMAKLDRASLEKLLAGLDNLPPAKRTGEVLLVEKKYFVDWQIDQLKDAGTKAYEILIHLYNVPAQEIDRPSTLSEKPTQEDVDKLVRQLEQMAAQYEEWAAMATLPAEEYERTLNKVEEQLKKDNPLAEQIIPGAINFRYDEARAETTMAMFRAAIGIVLDNPKEVVAPLDAQGKPLFEYHKTENGFELTSTSLFRGKAEKLSVPGK